MKKTWIIYSVMMIVFLLQITGRREVTMETKYDLNHKMTLSVEEASLLSGIGINTIYRMMKNHQYDFVLWIGKRRRIKREAFEKMIRNTQFIDVE